VIVLFQNRREGGRRLAERLARLPLGPDPIVLALPRGGVPVGFEVAAQLGLPLDVFVVRKLGVPGHEELAMGAVASGGLVVLNEDLIVGLGILEPEVGQVIEDEQRELARREREYRHGPPPEVAGRGVILVDDGLATGATMRAAAGALRRLEPARLTVAAPVGAPEACQALAEDADQVVCAATQWPVNGVGMW
jgi:predicted phosphoribosyltransferase